MLRDIVRAREEGWPLPRHSAPLQALDPRGPSSGPHGPTLSWVMAYRLARSAASTRSLLILLLISTRTAPYSVELPSGAKYT